MFSQQLFALPKTVRLGVLSTAGQQTFILTLLQRDHRVRFRGITYDRH